MSVCARCGHRIYRRFDGGWELHDLTIWTRICWVAGHRPLTLGMVKRDIVRVVLS